MLVRRQYSLLTQYVQRFRPSYLSTMSESPAKKRKLAEKKGDRLVWVDLEMTGLNVDTDHILEMACLITDSQLNLIAESPDLIIHQPDSVLDSMGEWCQQHHGQYSSETAVEVRKCFQKIFKKNRVFCHWMFERDRDRVMEVRKSNVTLKERSGLTASVKNSKISLKEAEKTMVSFVKEHTEEGLSPLAGNSVHADKQFLVKHMPDFMEHLHYRIVDVSTIKELCRRWYPDIYKNAPKKKETHRALDDIKESIEELKYYRKTIFQDNNQS